MRPHSAARGQGALCEQGGFGRPCFFCPPDVLEGFGRRVAPGRFNLTVTEEIAWEPHPEDPEKELVINTRNQARAVEKVLYEHPELWLWIHRRWKVQPEGVPNPYGA